MAKPAQWLNLVLAIYLSLAVAACGQGSDEGDSQRLPDGHVVVDLYGYPFLIPQDYFRKTTPSGSQSELALIANLPDIGPNGKSAQEEWANGSPKLLRIGVFPPTLYTRTREGNLFPEQVVENLINLFEMSRHKYGPPFKLIAFKQEWSTFLERNADHEEQVLDATHLLGWDSIGTPPEKRLKSDFVAISKGRVVMYGQCDKPRPDRDQYSPQCRAYFQEPDSVFVMSLGFNALHKDKALQIARRLTKRIKAFNQNAIFRVGRGKLAFVHE